MTPVPVSTDFSNWFANRFKGSKCPPRPVTNAQIALLGHCASKGRNLVHVRVESELQPRSSIVRGSRRRIGYESLRSCQPAEYDRPGRLPFQIASETRLRSRS